MVRPNSADRLVAARARCIPVTLPPKPLGCNQSRWQTIEALAAHLGGAPFSIPETAELLGCDPGRIKAAISNRPTRHLFERLAPCVWRINPSPLANPRFGPKRQAQLDRAQAELGEEFSRDEWLALGLLDGTLSKATAAGVLERAITGRYRFMVDADIAEPRLTLPGQAQLDRARAELGEAFTTAQWKALGLHGLALRTFTAAGLLERIAPGCYRFTSARATAAEHTAASAIAAE